MTIQLLMAVLWSPPLPKRPEKAHVIFSFALKRLLGKTIHDSQSTYFPLQHPLLQNPCSGIQALKIESSYIYAGITASTSTESMFQKPSIEIWQYVPLRSSSQACRLHSICFHGIQVLESKIRISASCTSSVLHAGCTASTCTVSKLRR